MTSALSSLAFESLNSKTTVKRSVQCTPPKNNQKLIDGSNKKTNQTKPKQTPSCLAGVKKH